MPLKLPGGVWEDTLEAALHLVKAPNALLVVDGYNVAKLGWPDQLLAEQRTRLLDALDELAARYGTDIRVVFDGADVRNVPGRRRYLKVEFSPPGVTADDVIVELADLVPADRPLIVATNDREVRAGVRAAGANLLASEQLLAVARR
jgi:predicted RNA-binding protein with PIN domain